MGRRGGCQTVIGDLLRSGEYGDEKRNKREVNETNSLAFRTREDDEEMRNVIPSSSTLCRWWAQICLRMEGVCGHNANEREKKRPRKPWNITRLSPTPTHSHHSHRFPLRLKRARFKYHLTTRSNFSRLPPCYPRCPCLLLFIYYAVYIHSIHASWGKK